MNEETKTNPSTGISNIKFALGIVFLLIAIAASFILSGDHLGLLEAPGCGDGGGCDQAISGKWGKIPGLNWPVAFIGLAYFASLFIAWMSARIAGGLPTIVKNIIRLGAVFSIMFIVIMAVSGNGFCKYCMAIHLANFGFLLVVELSGKNNKATLRAISWAATAFVIVSGIQFGLMTNVKEEVKAKEEKSTEKIIEAITENKPPRFTGRYTLGPADAPIRIVIFSDYSCPNCQVVEHELGIIMSRRDDVSVSPKHYPFCTDCNSHVSRNMHPASCRAARAAEAAGILGGLEAFEEMHKWLFLKNGRFTTPQLHEKLNKLQLSPSKFTRLMNGKETLALVQEDIEEAASIGLTHTPMIFINGVELHGSSSPGTVLRAVAKVAKTNPTSNSPTEDHPISAHDRYLEQWKIQATKRLPADNTKWPKGSDSPAVTVVLWGDFFESNTNEADEILRKLANLRSDMKYVFRHFPANADCNPLVTKTVNPMACQAALAAEAAGKLAGSKGYWAMHKWLMELQDTLSDNLLRSAAKRIGIDPDKFLDEMQSTGVAEALSKDVSAAQRLGASTIPWIYINGKRVPGWRLEGFNILEEIIQEAASGSK